MFEVLKEKLNILIKKMAGATKSLTVIVIGLWQAVVQNFDDIQAQFPQLHQYFGDDAMKYISAIFGVLLVYIRFFHTKKPLQDKIVKKEVEPKE